jgi:hypothetical protein
MLQLKARLDECGLSDDAAFLSRAKQWLRLASRHGDFPLFDLVKRATSAEELLGQLRNAGREDQFTPSVDNFEEAVATPAGEQTVFAAMEGGSGRPLPAVA